MTDIEPTPSLWQRMTAIPVTAWGVILLLTFFAAPVIFRLWSLSQVPDIGDPFDVAEFSKRDVPADQNAILVYEAALTKYDKVNAAVKTDPDQHGRNPGIAFETRKNTPEERELIAAWRIAHRDALLEWKRGTTFPLAQHAPLATFSSSVWSDIFSQVQRVSLLARLEAEEFEQQGDMAIAWEWHLASFRFSRHLGHKGTLLNRLFGKSVYLSAVNDLVRWAEHPAVKTDQLRDALDEVRSSFSKTAPWADVLKLEYVWLNEQLSKTTLHELAAGGSGLFLREPVLSRQFRLWVVGEPHLLLRLQRQILANSLEEMGKPLTQQRPKVSYSPLLFQVDSNRPDQMNPADIKFAVQRSFGNGTYWATGAVSNAFANHEEEGRQAVLEVTLALQRYRREHGEFPAELSRLVPQYLDVIPVDPCDPKGEPIRYRREEPLKAVVWSVGPDHSDQGGLDLKPSSLNPTGDLGYIVK